MWDLVFFLIQNILSAVVADFVLHFDHIIIDQMNAYAKLESARTNESVEVIKKSAKLNDRKDFFQYAMCIRII